MGNTVSRKNIRITRMHTVYQKAQFKQESNIVLDMRYHDGTSGKGTSYPNRILDFGPLDLPNRRETFLHIIT